MPKRTKEKAPPMRTKEKAPPMRTKEKAPPMPEEVKLLVVKGRGVFMKVPAGFIRRSGKAKVFAVEVDGVLQVSRGKPLAAISALAGFCSFEKQGG